MKGSRNRVHLAPLILALLLAYGCADTTSLSDLKPPTSWVAFPDTDAGFRTFINELVDAHATGRGVQGRMHALLIPNSSTWFIKVFGPTTGPTLDFQYRNQLRWQFERLYARLPIGAQGQNHLVFPEHCERGHLSPTVTDSELIPLAEQPLRIYSAAIAIDDSDWLVKIGSFVYVDGNFRFLGALEIKPNWDSFYQAFDKPF